MHAIIVPDIDFDAVGLNFLKVLTKKEKAMNINYFMAQTLMDQVYNEKLQEAARERLWKKAARGVQRATAGRVAAGKPGSLVTV